VVTRVTGEPKHVLLVVSRADVPTVAPIGGGDRCRDDRPIVASGEVIRQSLNADHHYRESRLVTSRVIRAG
jgi:hypothetical protein